MGAVIVIASLFIIINIFCRLDLRVVRSKKLELNNMRKNIVAGNWKMNNDLAATKTLISELIELNKTSRC